MMNPGTVSGRLCILFICFFFPFSMYAQFNFQWRDGIIGTGEIFVDEVDEDAAGNTYIIGRINGAADFDPGPGVANRTSTGNTDPFLAKYDVNGNFIWANVIQSNFSGWGVTPFQLKIAQNSIYVGGTFIGTTDFDPGPGVANVTGVGNLAPFFGRYDLNGNYMWVKTVGSANNDQVTGLDVDAAGNVYLSFVCGGVAVDFDPGPAVVSVPVTANDGVFGKYDNAGNYIYAKSFASTGGGWHPCMDIATDNAGNAFVTGTFDGTIDINPGPAVTNITASGLDAYITKFDAAGNYLWHGQYTGAGTEVGATLKTDLSDNSIYIGGYFDSPSIDVNIGPGTATLTVTAAINGFLAKYDAAGIYLWSVNVNGNGAESVSDIDLDGCNNVYITGNFTSSSLDLDPSAAVTTFSTAGAEDFFLAKYTNAGAYIYAAKMGGPGSDVAYTVSMNPFNGRVSVGGYFNQTADFDPGPGTATLTANGINDGFFATYSESPPAPANLTPPGNLTICPGDSTMLIVNGSASGTVYWEDASGNIVGTGDTLLTGPLGSTTIFIFRDSLFCLPSSQSDTITVNVANLSVSILSSDTSVCSGDTVVLTGSGAATYVWSPGGATTPVISVTPGSTTTYTLVGQGGSCSDTAQVTIYASPQPVPHISGSPANCNGDTAVFTVDNGPFGSYVWSNGDLDSVTTILTAGTYTVTVTNTCSGSATITVTFENPTISIVAPPSFCGGDSVQVSANPIAPFVNFLWSNGETVAAPYINAPGTYAVVGTTALGCTATASATVNLLPDPQGDIVLPATTCAGQVVGFNFNNTGIPVGGYYWDFGAPGAGDNSTVPNPDYTYPGPGSYQVVLVLSGDNGCTDTVSAHINIHPQPQGTIHLPPSVCEGGSALFSVNSGDSITGYTWVFPSGSPSASSASQPEIEFPTPGIIPVQVVISTQFGCSAVLNQDYIVRQNPHPDFETYQLCISRFTFDPTGAPDDATVTLDWNMDDGTAYNDRDTSIFNHNYTAPGTYNVTLVVTDTLGCVGSVTKPVNVADNIIMEAPTILYRSSHIENDKVDLEHKYPGFNLCISYTYTIFDRWGVKVFETHNDPASPDLYCDKCFMGKDQNGNALSAGVYYFILEGNFNVHKVGYITVMD